MTGYEINIDYKDIVKILNEKKEVIENYIKYINDNKKILEQQYKEKHYMMYRYNLYTDAYGLEFKLSESNFEKLFDESFNFLNDQKDFLDMFLSLKNMKTEGKFSVYTNKLIQDCINTLQYNFILNTDYIENFYSILNQPNLRKNYIGIILLQEFFQYDEDIVLIGGNGSGKSSFANQLKGNDTELIAVIPAQKNLYFSINDTSLLTTELSELITLLFENNISKGKADNFTNDYFNFQNNQFTRLILGMQSEFTSYLYTCERNQIVADQDKTIFGKVRNVFKVLFPDIELRFEDGKIHRLSCIKSGKKYNINGLSEGEKVVLYYAISVFMAKENSFIIVDEPETYINPSLTNVLWDTLTKERKDCQFIFITHSIDFVLGRSNSKIAWIKNYEYPSTWQFEILEDDNDFPKPMLTEILGSKKPIVFCEGDDKASLDYHIYKSILEKYFTIIPTQGHYQVISCCRALNKLGLNYKAWGIIDGDCISEEKKKKYMEDNIFVLPFNEIEMFILEEKIIMETIKSSYPMTYESKIGDFIQKFWEEVETEKEKIVLSYVKFLVDEYIERWKITSVKNLSEIEEGLSDITKIKIQDYYDEKSEELREIILKKDYQRLLKVCNLKKKISKGIANQYLDADYEEKAKQQIISNVELQKYLKEIYFGFLFVNNE